MLKQIINKCNEMDGIKKEYVRRKKLTVGGSNYFAFFKKELVLQ